MRSTEDGLKNDQRNSSLQSDAAVPGEDGISVEVIETAAGRCVRCRPQTDGCFKMKMSNPPRQRRQRRFAAVRSPAKPGNEPLHFRWHAR